MRAWLLRVPGFRSGVLWKKIVAGAPGGPVLGVMALAVVLPATNAGVRSRVPVLNSPNKLKAAAGWVGLAFAGLLAFAASTPPNC